MPVAVEHQLADQGVPLPPSFLTCNPATGSNGSGRGVVLRSGGSLRLVINRHRLTLVAGTFDPDQTLLEFLRSGAGGVLPRLTGTKLGCAEGGCGACTVVVGKVQATCEPSSPPAYEYKAVNACLLPLLACHGAHVLTVEGIGSSEQPHPIQERIGKLFGSQCGFVGASSCAFVGLLDWIY